MHHHSHISPPITVSSTTSDNPLISTSSKVIPPAAPIQHFEVAEIKSDVESQKPPPTFANKIETVWNGWLKYATALFCILFVYIFLIVFSSGQADSAASSSRSAIYTTPNINNQGWTVNTAVTPYAFGGIWNPLPLLTGSGNVNSTGSAARVEITFNSFNPSYTGGTSQALFRLIISQNWLDKTTKPFKPLFTTTCSIGSTSFSLTPSSTNYYVDQNTASFPFDSGTILKYPIDSYSVQANVYCTYSVSATTGTTTGYLNFYLAVGNTDVGLFSPSSSYTGPSAQHEIFFFTDDYTGVTRQDNFTYTDVNSANLKFTFARSSINVFFPIFMTMIMWMLIVAETMIFLPYYLEKKKADAPGIPLGCVGILFALPNIRNTMPGAPPLGVVLDFAAYFWCLTIAAGHFLAVSFYWVGLASNFTSKDLWIGAATLLHLSPKGNKQT